MATFTRLPPYRAAASSNFLRPPARARLPATITYLDFFLHVVLSVSVEPSSLEARILLINTFHTIEDTILEGNIITYYLQVPKFALATNFDTNTSNNARIYLPAHASILAQEAPGGDGRDDMIRRGALATHAQ